MQPLQRTLDETDMYVASYHIVPYLYHILLYLTFSSKDERDFGVCLYSGAGGNDPDLTVSISLTIISFDDIVSSNITCSEEM